jgi:very-short-patch-repair endonuclease
MEAPAATRHFAKTLRRRLSLPEVLLWRNLKGRQLDGLHFRKQHPIGRYILDFYCAERALCVEVDGGFHWTEDRRQRDEQRDRQLLAFGARTLRIRAGLVLEDMDTALRMIAAAAAERARPKSSPVEGGGPRRGGGG